MAESGPDGFQGLPDRTDETSLDHHVLTTAADRLDALAEMAELMGDEDGAQRALEAAETETGLPAADPVRTGVGRLVDRLPDPVQ